MERLHGTVCSPFTENQLKLSEDLETFLEGTVE